MMKETASQLDVLLLAMVRDRGHGHVLVEHRRAHGAFATTKGSRPVNTANVTPATYATHASTHSARFVTFLVLFVLHLTHETNGNGVKLIVQEEFNHASIMLVIRHFSISSSLILYI